MQIQSKSDRNIMRLMFLSLFHRLNYKNSGRTSASSFCGANNIIEATN